MGVFAGTERQCTEDEHDDEDEHDSQISEFGLRAFTATCKGERVSNQRTARCYRRRNRKPAMPDSRNSSQGGHVQNNATSSTV
jgi:hypothetical protein